MAEYIEREALKERFRKRLVWLKKDVHDEYSGALLDGCEYDMKLIDEIPATDVDPVVRCKDCCHSYNINGRRRCSHGICCGRVVPEGFYCADGERKENMDNTVTRIERRSDGSYIVTVNGNNITAV